MAWTAPTTQTTGTLITAAIWNRDVTDNLSFLGVTHDHSGDAGDGATIAGVPSGLVLMFDAACPTGWTRVLAWDGKFVRGAASYGGSGGAATHTHTYPAHVHAHTGHAAGYTIGAGSGTANVDGGSGSSDHVQDPVHTHADAYLGYTGSADTSSQAGGTSEAAASLPSYIDVIFCKKD